MVTRFFLFTTLIFERSTNFSTPWMNLILSSYILLFMHFCSLFARILFVILVNFLKHSNLNNNLSSFGKNEGPNISDSVAALLPDKLLVNYWFLKTIFIFQCENLKSKTEWNLPWHRHKCVDWRHFLWNWNHLKATTETNSISVDVRML